MASSDSWISRLSTSSRRYNSRSDLFEETEVDEDLKAEYLCPFCAEDFDVVGLCCHIDEEHPVEAKNGPFSEQSCLNCGFQVCPVCAKRVGADIVSHITMQHGNFFKIQRRRRLRKGGNNTTLSMLRKELRDGNLQSLLSGSSYLLSSSNSEPDPLLSSFIFNPPSADEPLNLQPLASVEVGSVKGSTTDEFRERKAEQPVVSDKEQEEKSRRCKFVQGLLMSTMFDD